jgi:signal transduction histidine kinase
VVVAYGLASAAAVGSGRLPARSPVFWSADIVASLALVVAGGTWRSPVYLLALTTLILPTTAGPPWRGLLATALFTTAYFGVALFIGVDWSTLDSTPRLETFSTHLLLPIVLGAGLTHGAELLRRLRREQEHSERLALEGERRRIARELHDSAKQRVHAAHLVLSSLARGMDDPERDSIRLALAELEAAGREMDSSLHDLRAATDEHTLLGALRRRARRLEQATGVDLDVEGEEPDVDGPRLTHAYHVLSEAMTNAVRHGRPSKVAIRIGVEGSGFRAEVQDDGDGLPSDAPWDSHGIRSMVERAELLGGSLDIGPGRDGTGTRVLLAVPVRSKIEAPR